MLRRRMMGNKKKVKVCEWITTVGSGNWSVPQGCKTIDYCVIAGGANGSGANEYGGNGGNGGGLINVYSVNLSTITAVSFIVGGPNTNSIFNNTIAVSGNGPAGGLGASKHGNGNSGSLGIFPFNNSTLFKRFCNGGGGGGYSLASTSAAENVYYDVYGGAPNGGKARSYWWYDSDWKTHYGQTGYSGGAGTYYGVGGGGGGYGRSSIWGDSSKGSGGAGYQGCIILIYERYKSSTDVVDSNTGFVKINWPQNA